MIEFRRYGDETSWIAAIVADFMRMVETTIFEGKQAVFGLAGGSTPAAAYRAMACCLVDRAASLAGPAVLVVGDERLRPGSPGERNETMIREAFSVAIDAGAAIVLGWNAEAGQEEAVADMITAFNKLKNGGPVPGGLVFDCCYQGLGADGHSAGIFPGTLPADSPMAVRGDDATLAMAFTAPTEPRERVSLTVNALRSSRYTRFIVRSPGKEAALGRLAQGDTSSPAYLAAVPDAAAYILD